MVRQLKSWKFLMAIVAIGSAMAFSACGNSGGGSSSSTNNVATTPCGSGTCDTTVYNSLPGAYIPTQAYSNGYANGYCGCASGYLPIYNSSWGYACVPSNYMTYQSYVGYSAVSTLASQNTAPISNPQVYYSPLIYGGTTCYTNFASACDVRAGNTCASGGYCRAIGGASTVGVCVSGTGIASYNTNTGYIPYSTYNTGYFPYSTYNTGYYPYTNYNTGYWGGGRCTYKQNSWGFWYSVCY